MLRNRIYFVFVFSWVLISPDSSWAAHSPLLPRPQKVEYKSGSIALDRLSIVIPSDAAAEDRFAAAELDRRVFSRTGTHLPLLQKNTSPSIVLERTGPIDALAVPGEDPGPDSREAYRLEVTASGIAIRARSSAGIFFGVQTLCQLLEFEQGKAVFPAVRIEDWPTLAYRGTMVDMSEGQLATEQEVLRQIDLLAMWKANQYYFYNESSIEMDGYPLVNPAARFTKDAVRRMIAYGRERHIDVVPCLELYGHQHDLFRIEKYSELADFPHGGEFDPSNPKIRAVLADWVDQYLDLFPSRFAHIGFDETWEIARSAREKGSAPAKLFLDQISFIAKRFQAKRKLVLAWGDIMVKYPGIAAQLPSGIVAVPWWYDPEADPDYKKWLDPLVEQKVPTLVAPGVHMWDEIFPDYKKTFRNIDTFLAAGKRAKTLGLVNTVWSDSQQGLRRSAWPGMAYGAAAAWQTQPMDSETFFSEYAAVVYRPQAAPRVATALEKLEAAELSLQKVFGQTTFEGIWRNPFPAATRKNVNEHREDLRQARLLAENAQENLLVALKTEDHTALTSLLLEGRLIDYAGMRALYALEISDLWKQIQDKNGNDAELWDLMETTMGNFHGRVGDLMDILEDLRPQYQENWLAEYTSFRLDAALMNWTMEAQFWWHFQRRFQNLREQYKPGSPLPAIEVLAGER